MKTLVVDMFLAASFLAILFAVPVTQVVYELAQGQRPQVLDVVTRSPTEEHLRAFESDLEESSWAAQAVRPLLRQVHFTVLRDPGSKVLLGRGEWLFYKPGVDYLAEASKEKPPDDNGPDAAIAAIVEFRDQLERRGIKLLVVPVPGKASVYPDRLTHRAARDDAPLGSPTADVIDKLRDKGVETVDLFTVLRRFRDSADRQAYGSTYLAHDTHWSPWGVRVAAKAIADRIGQLAWVPLGDMVYQRKEVEIGRGGDIVRMMQLPDHGRFYAAEPLRCQQIVRSSDSSVYRDDPHSPVLLLGDSFSRIYQRDEPGSAGLIAQLAYELKMPLASIVNDGGASTLVRQQLARRPELMKGKKLVIWQFAERDIRFGTEGWQVVPLPAVN